MRNLQKYCRPSSLGEAVQLLSREALDAVSFNGATLLLPADSAGTRAAVDLSGLPLAYVATGSDRLKIGALTSLQQLAASESANSFADGLIANCARSSCTSLLRAAQTVSGEILQPGPTGELCAALLVLDAEVELRKGAAARAMRIEELTGNLPGRSGLLTEIRVQQPPEGIRCNHVRLARSPSDRAILSVCGASRIGGEKIASAIVAISGEGLRPRRLRKVEDVLFGVSAKSEAIASAISVLMSAVEIPDRATATSAYCRAVLPALIARAVCESCR